MNRIGLSRNRANPCGVAATTAFAIWCLGVSFLANAQSLQERIVGTWTLESGSENLPHDHHLGVIDRVRPVVGDERSDRSANARAGTGLVAPDQEQGRT